MEDKMSALDGITMPRIQTADRPHVASPNKLMQAMADYDHLVDENVALRAELRQVTDIANKATADTESLKNQLRIQGEFFTRQITTVTAHRDRLERLLKGLLTRFKMIDECFEAAKREAQAEAIELNEKTEQLTPEDEQALANLKLGEVPAWRGALSEK